jgi:hypothetical protein
VICARLSDRRNTARGRGGASSSSLAKALQRGDGFCVMDAQPTPPRQLNGGSIGLIDAPQHGRGWRPVQEKIKLLVIVMVAAGAPLVVDTISHEDVSFGCGCPPRLMLNPKDDARRAPARRVFSIAGAGMEPFIEMIFADADSADARNAFAVEAVHLAL